MTPGEIWDMALLSSPSSPQTAIELARIPDYLASPWRPRADHILDYENWDDITIHDDSLDQIVRSRVRQPVKMLISVVQGTGAILDGQHPETLHLEGAANIEKHSSLYIAE